MNDRKNILICPLEWGLGHAGRMIPLAKRLLELNQNIIFGAGEELLQFLKIEVPQAASINFPGFRIRYSRYFPQYLIILINGPLLFWHSLLEHYRLKKIIREHSIDIVISDNRIGLWNSGIRSVYVTHQLRIIFPSPFRFLEFTGICITRSIIKRYTYCYIPDLEGDLNVSGILSHGLRLPENARYIGILSRLESNPTTGKRIPGKYTILLSGPEPQRSLLKQKLEKIFLSKGNPATFLEGKPGFGDAPLIKNNLVYHNHLPEDATIRLLRESEIIITRSGYTTVMELAGLGCSGLLIPTPGQTEQEYLAKYLSAKGWFGFVKQADLNESSRFFTGSFTESSEVNKESKKLLGIALSELLEK